MQVMHHLSNTEIKVGILRLKGGTSEFFSQFNDSFDMVIRGTKLYERSVGNKQIWIGRTIMKKFNPNDVLKISKKGNVVIIE